MATGTYMSDSDREKATIIKKRLSSLLGDLADTIDGIEDSHRNIKSILAGEEADRLINDIINNEGRKP